MEQISGKKQSQRLKKIFLKIKIKSMETLFWNSMWGLKKEDIVWPPEDVKNKVMECLLKFKGDISNHTNELKTLLGIDERYKMTYDSEKENLESLYFDLVVEKNKSEIVIKNNIK